MEYAYSVTLNVRSQLALTDDLIDRVFDAVTDSVPIQLGVVDQDLSASKRDSAFEFRYDIEEVASIDLAAAWTIVGLRNALREVGREYGGFDELSEITRHVAEKWAPPFDDE